MITYDCEIWALNKSDKKKNKGRRNDIHENSWSHPKRFKFETTTSKNDSLHEENQDTPEKMEKSC